MADVWSLCNRYLWVVCPDNVGSSTSHNPIGLHPMLWVYLYKGKERKEAVVWGADQIIKPYHFVLNTWSEITTRETFVILAAHVSCYSYLCQGDYRLGTLRNADKKTNQHNIHWFHLPSKYNTYRKHYMQSLYIMQNINQKYCYTLQTHTQGTISRQ